MILGLIGLYLVVVALAVIFSICMVAGSLGFDREQQTVQEARKFIKGALIWPVLGLIGVYMFLAGFFKAVRLLIRGK